ncbi:MAG: hypothetical protein L0G22_08405 [Propionibacteriaceae bacterium]|nr:hypothetical protein [Propionibacteriaceae bacterium]
MRIAVLTSQRVPSTESVTRSCLELLRSWGVDVDVSHHELELTDLGEMRAAHDLYLLKSPSDGLLSVAAGLQARGATCLNSPEMVRTCRDRIHATACLSAAGVPVPRAWAVRSASELADVLPAGPLVLKPARTDRGAGIRVLWDADELIDVPPADDTLFAQQFHPNDHRDRKLYRIGDQTFGVKRPWPATTYTDKVGEAFPLTSALREISDAAARALDSDLFGLDLVESAAGPLVVDVHPFPGFKGVPDAALRLADYIYAQGSEARARRVS